MLEMTTAAAERIRALQRDDTTRSVLRLYVAGQTCCSYRYGLAFDEAADENDTVAELEGIRVAVDAETRPHCQGATIDYVTTPQGEGFVVRGVKSGGCGCGRNG